MDATVVLSSEAEGGRTAFSDERRIAVGLQYLLNERSNRCVVFLFFFSSRRRHTRYIGDWSSDVCSSDLGRVPGWPARDGVSWSNHLQTQSNEIRIARQKEFEKGDLPTTQLTAAWRERAERSEERRVGKEARGGREPDG